MKLMAISDIHGELFWEKAVEEEDPDILIYLGDYFDSFYLSAEEQIKTFNKIITLKKKRKKRKKTTILLTGNHDHHYYPGIGYSGTSGYQSGASIAIEDVIRKNKDSLQLAYQYGKYLFTHAGVSETFLKYTVEVYNENNIADFLNMLFLTNPLIFRFFGRNSYGDDTCQTPLWIRPKSLMRDTAGSFLQEKYIQVVGHTAIDSFYYDLPFDIEEKFIFLDGIKMKRYLIVKDDKQEIKNYGIWKK